MNQATKIEAPPETLLGALAKALPELESAKKNADNPAFKQGGKAIKYADLGSVIEAIRPIARHGLWFRQVDLEREGGAAVETFYIHETGELSAGVTFVPTDRGNAQGYGSAKTYARRYGLQCAFGLASEDDDGNAAAAAPPKQTEAQMPAAEWAKLIQLVEATNTNPQTMLKALKINVPDLKALSPDQYNTVIDALEKKLAKLAKAESDAKAKEAVDA